MVIVHYQLSIEKGGTSQKTCHYSVSGSSGKGTDESKRYAEYICKTIVGPVMCLAVSVCRFVCAGRHDDLSPAFGCRGAGKGTPFHHPREHAAPDDGQGRDRTTRCAGLVGSRKTLLRCDRTGLRRHRRFENRFRPQPWCQTYGCLL